MLKDLTSCPLPGMTNENKNISVRITSLWAKFLNLRPSKYEAEALTTCSHVWQNNGVYFICNSSRKQSSDEEYAV
jgi:hypothetical protein